MASNHKLWSAETENAEYILHDSTTANKQLITNIERFDQFVFAVSELSGCALEGDKRIQT